MALELIVLGPAQVGYLKQVIADLKIASTKKTLKRCRDQIYSALYAIASHKMKKVKSIDLKYVRECYNAQTLDLTWEFWYEYEETNGAA
jgi:hypothetical protein